MYTASLSIDNILNPQLISLQTEVSIREFIEVAFVQLQTGQNADPFKFTIDYFGYDYFQGNKSYLGYFIVSINGYSSSASQYWDLIINGQPSTLGMDSYLVQPDDQIELKWVTSPPKLETAAARYQSARARRTAQA